MIDFISKESSITFEKKCMAKALEIFPNTLSSILTTISPVSIN